MAGWGAAGSFRSRCGDWAAQVSQCLDGPAHPPTHTLPFPAWHPPPFRPQRLIDHFGLKPEGELTLLIDDPKAPAKYLKGGVKPSDIPEFVREFQASSSARWRLGDVAGSWAGWRVTAQCALGVPVVADECRSGLPAPAPAPMPVCRRAPLRSG